jgi:hypothetical protein
MLIFDLASVVQNLSMPQPWRRPRALRKLFLAERQPERLMSEEARPACRKHRREGRPQNCV